MKADPIELFQSLSKENIDRLFSYDCCELSCDFLGLLENYADLPEKIPKDFTIIDIGCNQAVQADYFKAYKYYIGIDDQVPRENRFNSYNSIHIQMDASNYLRLDMIFQLFSIVETFIIMSGVIDKDNSIANHIRDKCKYYRIAFPGKETIEALPEV